MCTVSMVMDHFNQEWDPYKKFNPIPQKIENVPNLNPLDLSKLFEKQVGRFEFDQLKREVENMKKLLERAIEYDKKNNEPHCELEEKIATIKKIAQLVGVDLEEIFKK
jgi:phage terminase large subunit-like protein